MKHRRKSQYTIRAVPSALDQALRQKSRVEGRSLNEVSIEALTYGTGLGEKPILHHDLDFLIGSWKNDSQFDAAIRAQDQIDPSIW